MEKISSYKTQVNNAVKENYNQKKDDQMLSAYEKKFKLTKKEVEQNLSSIEDSIEQLTNCKNCKKLDCCKNKIKGYVYYPNKKESNLTFDYIPCKLLKEYELKVQSKEENYIFENARMKDIDPSDGNRIKIITWINDFFHNYDPSQINKGLYLHGSFGSGKTFLIAALFNELKIKKNIDYEIVYFPELLRTLKDNFYTLDSKVRYYSNIELLLIDDIGAEKVSDWGRDEILGTILQYRMNKGLTTFFTSNLNIKELEQHLSITKDQVDIVKAKRIIERIKQLTEDLELISINRRS